MQLCIEWNNNTQEMYCHSEPFGHAQGKLREDMWVEKKPNWST